MEVINFDATKDIGTYYCVVEDIAGRKNSAQLDVDRSIGESVFQFLKSANFIGPFSV